MYLAAVIPRERSVLLDSVTTRPRMDFYEGDEPEEPKQCSEDELVVQLQQKRSQLVDKSHHLHEQSEAMDKEIEQLRAIFDEERSLKQSAVRRLAEKLCNPQCAKIGPFTPKGNLVYERRIRQLKGQLDADEMEMLKKRQMAIDMYNDRISELDSALARKDDDVRRLQVKLVMKQREIDDLQLGLEPKSEETGGVSASTKRSAV